jgi:hypothetical protein
LFSTSNFNVPELLDFKVVFNTPNPLKVVANRGKDQMDRRKTARATGGGLLIHSDPFALINSHLLC